jgi:hypothetical protein
MRIASSHRGATPEVSSQAYYADYETIGAGDLIDVVATPFELDPAFDDVAKIIFRNLAAIILFPAVIGPLQAAPEIMTQAVVSGMFGH